MCDSACEIHRLVTALRSEPCLTTSTEQGGKPVPLSEDELSRVSSLLSKVNCTSDSFGTYAKAIGHSNACTRHLIACDPGFSVLLMKWGPGHVTPKHKHDEGMTSWMKVIGGSVKVEQFSEDGDVTASKVSGKDDDVVVMPPAYGYHASGNGSEDENAMSIHVFSPPLVECCVDDNTILPVVYGPSGASGDTVERLAAGKGASFRVPMYPNFQQLTSILSSEIEVGGGSSHTPEHIDYIKNLLGSMHFNPDEWLQYAKFVNNRYTRNLVGYDEKFTILILCWDVGQESPIHDHAGSSCWVKVLEGNLTETLYEMPAEETAAGESPAPLKEVSRTTYPTSGVTYINDSMGLHKMSNLSATQRSVTMHIYSPPYRSCNCFDVLTSAARHVPVTAEHGLYHKFMDNKVNPGDNATDLERLVATIDDAFISAENEKNPCSSSGNEVTAVQHILDNFNFRPEEWRQYVHFSDHRYVRALLGHTERFSLFLNCWNKNQSTPPHTHGTGRGDPKVWIKVLEGVVAMKTFPGGDASNEDDARLKLLNSSTPATCFGDNIGLHSTQNPSSEHTSISLHVYSPPYIQCVSAEDKSVSMPVSYCSPAACRRTSTEGELDSGIACKGTIFGTISEFTEVLRAEMGKANEAGEVDIARITDVMNCVALNPAEIDTYTPADTSEKTTPTRTLVAFGDGFNVIMSTFAKGASSTSHGHNGSVGWLKSVRGRVVEERKNNTGGVDTTNIAEGEVVEVPADAIHSLKNESEDVAYLLQVFAPALSDSAFV